MLKAELRASFRLSFLFEFPHAEIIAHFSAWCLVPCEGAVVRWLGGAASVKKAVAKLERENIIYNCDGEYRFGSPFFSEWLLRR